MYQRETMVEQGCISGIITRWIYLIAIHKMVFKGKENQFHKASTLCTIVKKTKPDALAIDKTPFF